MGAGAGAFPECAVISQCGFQELLQVIQGPGGETPGYWVGSPASGGLLDAHVD